MLSLYSTLYVFSDSGATIMRRLPFFVHPSVTLLWFPCTSRQTTQVTDFKLGGHIHYGTPQIWLTFGQAPLNLHHFLASDLWSSFCAFSYKSLIRLTYNLVSKLIRGLPPTWLIFGHNQLNSHRFLASDLLSCFCTFVDKPQIGLSSNLVRNLIGGLLSLINLWSHSAEFPPFPGLWLVKQFLPICRCTANLMELKFGWSTHYGPPQVWLTFGHAPLHSCHFPASD